MTLLKELSKSKHQGTQYKGINDEILAKSSPSEKTSKTIDAKVSKSLFNNIKNPDPRKGK